MTGGMSMAIRQNIYAKPFVVTVRRNGAELDLVYWAADRKELKERLKSELAETIELVRIKER